MSIVRWNPFCEREEMREGPNRMFARGPLSRTAPESNAMTVFDALRTTSPSMNGRMK
jgi:hypothetical protein